MTTEVKVFQSELGRTKYELKLPSNYVISAELHRHNSDGQTVIYFPQDLLRKYCMWQVQRFADKLVQKLWGLL